MKFNEVVILLRFSVGKNGPFVSHLVVVGHPRGKTNLVTWSGPNNELQNQPAEGICWRYVMPVVTEIAHTCGRAHLRRHVRGSASRHRFQHLLDEQMGQSGELFGCIYNGLAHGLYKLSPLPR